MRWVAIARRKLRGGNRMKLKSVCVVGSLFMVVGAFVFTCPFRARAQGRDVSRMVPQQVGYATGLVQRLSDGGLWIRRVALSKYNGGYFGPTKAVWVETDKGILDAVFFDKAADLERIQLHEEQTGDPKKHKYTVSLPNGQTVTWDMGHAAVYFIKYQDALIITRSGDLNEALNFLLR
jgi:hypothetical protein